MPFGYFIRTEQTPIRLRLRLDGPVEIVKPGQVIYVDANVYKDIVGFSFVGWTDPTKAIQSDTIKETLLVNNDSLKLYQINTTKNQEVNIIPEAKQVINVLEEDPVTPVVQKTREQILQEALTEAEQDIPDDKNKLIIELKGYTWKQWNALNKEKAIEICTILGLDASAISLNRQALTKFIKDSIQSV